MYLPDAGSIRCSEHIAHIENTTNVVQKSFDLRSMGWGLFNLHFMGFIRIINKLGLSTTFRTLPTQSTLFYHREAEVTVFSLTLANLIMRDRHQTSYVYIKTAIFAGSFQDNHGRRFLTGCKGGSKL